MDGYCGVNDDFSDFVLSHSGILSRHAAKLAKKDLFVLSGVLCASARVIVYPILVCYRAKSLSTPRPNPAQLFSYPNLAPFAPLRETISDPCSSGQGVKKISSFSELGGLCAFARDNFRSCCLVKLEFLLPVCIAFQGLLLRLVQ